jgi:cytochrome bd ubiquinol oxidase subunit II
MDLNTVWFVLIGVLFTGFFFLEGFDYGVGILLPFLGKDDTERRIIINSIGPFWDGNEVWLITAGGAMFAAFPHWYATTFSGFYLPLVLMLLALIVRGVAFEFRSKDRSPRWRKWWDWMLFVGSLVPALLWGVALANFLRGVPIDASMTYVGGFFNLLNPLALVSGLAAVLVFIFHGAIFLSMKTGDDMSAKARAAAQRVWLPATIVAALALGLGYFTTDMASRLGMGPIAIPVLASLALLVAGWFVSQSRLGVAFILTGISIALTVVSLFVGLYPRVLVSSLNPDWSLTVFNASSSPYTLGVMSIVALIFVPIVLLYQAWSYYIFRQRLVRDSSLEY